MKILVLSDIHAFVADPKDSSYIPSRVQTGTPDNVASTFEQLVSTDEFPKIDLIVCPGDLGDRANPTAIDYAWKFLQRLSDRLGKCPVISTAGNHDIDSRYQNNTFDAKGILNELDPLFPSYHLGDCLFHASDAERQLWFWAKNFYIYSKPDFRFVVLNSSAYHGAGKNDAAEHEHGRVSDLTLRQIKLAIDLDNKKRDTDKVEKPKANIFICHHHVRKDGAINDADYSSMQGAHSLLELLSDSDYGRWLVIHGHRHRAKTYFADGSTGPYVLSAASFASTLAKDLDNPSPNQCHVVDLEPLQMSKTALYPSGKIETWSHVKDLKRWVRDGGPTGGLPASMGFGFRGSLDSIAKEISNHYLQKNIGIDWSEIQNDENHFAYLDATQLMEIKKTLKNDYKLELQITDGRPEKVMSIKA